MNIIDPEQYESQLAEKISHLKTTLSHIELPTIEVFRSPPRHFRMRAEFRIWHEGDRSFYAMTPPGEKRPQPIERFDIGSRPMVELMPGLLAAIEGDETLRRKLYAIEFLTTLSGERLVTLIYHKRLEADWAQAAQKLGDRFDIDIVGRSRKQKVVLGRDYVVEKLAVAGRTYNYQQVETGFTQPNAEVNRHMLTWALEVSKGRGGDLLELYCGNGNFTLVLAQNFDHVLATEVSKLSVKSARHNLAANGIDNVEVVRLSSEEAADALAGVRPFRRLRHLNLADYRFSTLFVDPPRAGLDPASLALAAGFERVLYISCNPATLAENLEQLRDSHRVERFAVFDQFPYTGHLECGALLVPRKPSS